MKKKKTATTVGTLVSLIPWKYTLTKSPALCIYWFNQMDELIIFFKSSYQRDLCLASINRIKPFNGKAGQRDSTKISGSSPKLDVEILPSHFEI